MSAEANAGTADRGGSTPQFADSSGVRQYLVDALNLDLVGPGPSHHLAGEQLPGWIPPIQLVPNRFLGPLRYAV